MAIHKKDGSGYFAAIDSRVIRGRMLSVPAIGLLAVLLDRPRTWQVRLSELTNNVNLRPDETARLFSELLKAGFAVERRDRYGLYYDVYSFPESPPQKTAAEAAPPTAEPVPPTAEPAPPTAEPAPPTAELAPPTAEPAPEAKRGPGPMTDDERAAWFHFIKANFKPSPDYRSPYRD